MRIHRITLERFKGVSDRTVEFPAAGITVLEGRNESGKSSTVEALDLLLEAPDSSTARAVKAAAPVGEDTGVAVEAEITLRGHRLLYRKQWLRSRATTLRFLEGPQAGRTLTGREAHDAVAELQSQADPTLWAALRLLQSGPSATRLTDSSALRTALEQASGGVAQTDEAQSLLALARAERDRYWTATGRENATTRELRDRHQAAVDAHESAARRLERIGEAADALERAIRTVEAVRRGGVAAQAEARAAQAAAEQLERLGEQRRAAAAAVDVAQERARQATAERARRTSLAEEAEAAERELAEARSRVEARQETARIASDAERQQQERLVAAGEQEEAARRTAESLRTAQRRVADARRLEELGHLVEQLDEVRRALDAAPTQTGPSLTPEAVAELEEAQRTVDRAADLMEAGSAQLQVTALESALAVQVQHEEVELVVDRPLTRAVTEPVEVELPGRLRISVAPEQDRQERGEALRRAREQLERLLRRWGVASVPDAREQLRQDMQAQQERRALAERRTLLLARRDEDEVRREHARLARALDDTAPDPAADPRVPEEPLPGTDPETAAEAVDRAEEEAERAREGLSAAQAAAAGAAATLSAAREELRAAEAEERSRARQAEDARQRLSQARADADDDRLAEAVQLAERQLEQARADQAALDEQWERRDADQVLERHEALQRRADSLREQLERAREDRSRAEGALGELDREARQRAFDEALTLRRALTRELSSHLRRAAAARLLADTLEDAQAQAHRRYTEPFRQRLERLGSRVFGSGFRVELDEDLRITRRHLHGRWLELAQLSTGAREQLAVLVCLAVATLVDPDEGVPVILDDALGHSDAQRLASLAGALDAAGREAQLILLTAAPERFAALEDAHVVRLQD